MSTRRFPACIMGTAVVPWTADYALDEALFRHEIGTLIRADYPHLYIFGTAGEGYAVDEAQFEQVAHVFVDEMRAGHAEPMIGVISLSMNTMLRRIAVARDTLGVHLFQVSLPSWGALEDAEVRSFFDTVLGRFEDCQFLHYNLLRTKRLVSADEYALIAADHPNLVATENSTDSMVRVRDLVVGAPVSGASVLPVLVAGRRALTAPTTKFCGPCTIDVSHCGCCRRITAPTRLPPTPFSPFSRSVSHTGHPEGLRQFASPSGRGRPRQRSGEGCVCSR